MDTQKCVLHVVGPQGSGKSYLINKLKEFFTDKKLTDIYNLQNDTWFLTSENAIIQVDIILSSNLSDVNFNSHSSDSKKILLYYFLPTLTVLSQDEINKLKLFSKDSTVIILPLYSSYEAKVFRTFAKDLFPFLEYILPPLNRNESRSYYEISYILTQIIKNCQFSSYPIEYAKKLIKENLRTKSSVLDLGFCGLTSLEPLKELINCTHLKELILSNEWGEYDNNIWVRRVSANYENKYTKQRYYPNILFKIPKEISKLKNLEVLIAGGNWKDSKRRKSYFSSDWYISDVSPLINLKNLSILNLSNNKIENIEPIFNLIKLEKLYLNNNDITHIQNLNRFVKIKELYLSNNHIKDINFLSSLTSVNTIDLHSNEITDLSPIVRLITKVGISYSKWENKTISIANNPLSIPPEEVVIKGTKNVLVYFAQLEAENKIQLSPYINNDIKLIIVGNSNVGKSTLVHWLKTGKLNNSIPTTHWLDFGVWKTRRQGKEYTVRIFDFGGQEYYHDTHHLFFTNRTAYLILWDKDSNKFSELEINQRQRNGVTETVKIETFPLEYWLDSIRYHTHKRVQSRNELSISKMLHYREQQIDNSKKFQIFNSELLDNITEDYDQLENYQLEKDSINKLDEEYILVLQNKVDTKNMKTFIDEENFKSNYPNIYDFDEISLFNNVNKKLELSRNYIYDIFDSLEILNKQYLGSWNYLKRKIEKFNFIGSMSENQFQKYCNSIIEKLPELEGKSDKIKKSVLFDLDDTRVFASFLTDIGLCLYYPEDPSLKNKVFLNQKEILSNLNKVLLNINTSTGEITEIEIGEILGESESNYDVEDLISLMLHFKIIFNHPNKSKKSFIAPLYLPIEPPKSLKLFQSLFEKPLYKFVYKSFIHKSIILDFFHTYGAHASSENNEGSSFFFWKNGIVIKGDDNGELVMVRFVPWNDENKCAHLDVYSINSTKQNYVKKIIDHIDSINQGITVEKLVSSEINDDFVPLDIIHRNENEENPVFFYNEKYHKLTSFKKYLKTELKMKKLFISYSKQDLKLVNKFIEHLSALQRDGKVSHWYCSELEAGSNWNDEIQKHFDDSDIVCFMISPNFMKTDYIHEHEIKKAFERKKADPNFKIVPIILNFCRWTTANNNLGEFTALPYTAKPVMDFKNQDMAWYIIEACLRLMIENDLNPTGEDFYNKQKLPSDILKIYNRIVEDKVDNNSL